MIDEIEKAIGYVFINKELLVRAFTHSSYAYENGVMSNEQFEFLGDGVLNFIIADVLFDEHATEGNMSEKRASIVKKEPLCRAIESSGLTAYIKFGKGECGKDHTGMKLHSDALEALFGAVYLDGGLPSAKQVVLRILKDEIYGSREINDKGRLQEYVQKHKLGEIEYIEIERGGLDHELEFRVAVMIGHKKFGEGRGKKKQDAEKDAAKAALSKITGK